MVVCYGSADGVGLKAQALYREKFPAFANISGCCLRQNGTFRLHSSAKVLWVIQMRVDQPDFMRIVLLTEFLTPIFISANPGRCSNFCKGSGQSTSKGTGVF
jgi:hypothetical protein